MPPKTAGGNVKAKGPSKQELDAIKDYLSQKPDFAALLKKAQTKPQSASKPTESQNAYERELRKAISNIVVSHKQEND